MPDIEDLSFAPAPRRADRIKTAHAVLKTCAGCSGKRDARKKTADRRNPLVSPITTSVFELFKIGIGPSSSHTVGPMLACRNFSKHLLLEKLLDKVLQVKVELFGSLALTGIGHYTDKACILGLAGFAPDEVDPSNVNAFLAEVAQCGSLCIGFGAESSDYHTVDFEEKRDLILTAKELPLHPNAMACRAFGQGGELLKEIRYYSVGGGFILSEEEMTGHADDAAAFDPPMKFNSMAELLRLCEKHELSVADLMRRNEEARRDPGKVQDLLGEIWNVMETCVDDGLRKEKIGEDLPGPLNLKRRAPDLYQHAASEKDAPTSVIPSSLMDEMRWLDCYALAVMEQNATMGRVVTAPTNGAAGVVPAVLTYYMRHLRSKQAEGDRQSPSTFLLTAAAVGILAKENACISGAAGGCQAEVGTATAMAAAGLCAVLGGTPSQVAHAAEIALEHSLGMTCDPVLGLVQVPCIERNAMGASKAMNAVCLVLKAPSAGQKAMVSYDECLKVMKATGKDMNSSYRETALGGLAASYTDWLNAQDPATITKVEDMMGMSRIRWGDTNHPDEADDNNDINIFARKRAMSESLAHAKC